jgi:alpha-galactosidase
MWLAPPRGTLTDVHLVRAPTRRPASPSSAAAHEHRALTRSSAWSDGSPWYVTAASPDELDELATWITVHKEFRPLRHDGAVLNGDHADPHVQVHGVVAPDLRDAGYALVAVGRSVTWPPGPARLPGLDPNGRCRVRLQPPGCDAGGGWPGLPPWSSRSRPVLFGLVRLLFGRVSQLAELRARGAP